MAELLNNQTFFTISWIAILIAVGILEAIALFNSVRGDTLSEHLWALLGYRTYRFKNPSLSSGNIPLGPGFTAEERREFVGKVTPKWTTRVVRTILISAFVWFGLHIFANGWV